MPKGSIWLPGDPIEETGADHFTFQCDVCGKLFEQRARYEPMCTGPTWLDDHEPTVMRLVARHGDPSPGPRILPGMSGDA